MGQDEPKPSTNVLEWVDDCVQSVAETYAGEYPDEPHWCFVNSVVFLGVYYGISWEVIARLMRMSVSGVRRRFATKIRPTYQKKLLEASNGDPVVHRVVSNCFRDLSEARKTVVRSLNPSFYDRGLKQDE